MATLILFSILFLLSVVTAFLYRDFIKFTPMLILSVSLLWLFNGALAYYYPSAFQALAIVNIPCQISLLFVKGHLEKCFHF
jgi:hypothetical protein